MTPMLVVRAAVPSPTSGVPLVWVRFHVPGRITRWQEDQKPWGSAGVLFGRVFSPNSLRPCRNYFKILWIYAFKFACFLSYFTIKIMESCYVLLWRNIFNLSCCWNIKKHFYYLCIGPFFSCCTGAADMSGPALHTCAHASYISH
jgi:hypothetical protein